MTIMKISACLSFALTLTAAGCGSSSSNPDAGAGGAGAAGGQVGSGGNGGSGAIGGAGGTTTAGTGGAGGSANCGDIPSCFVTLISGCEPSGTCVEADTNTVTATTVTTTSNVCYANGVKAMTMTTADLTTDQGSGTIRYLKSNGATCFNATITTDSADNPVITFMNAAGTTVGTETTDAAGDEILTCTGGQPVIVNDTGNCDMPSGMTTSGDCTQGTCQ
jgi:hypothetical protein